MRVLVVQLVRVAVEPAHVMAQPVHDIVAEVKHNL